jgi:hypothetical protein
MSSSTPPEPLVRRVVARYAALSDHHTSEFVRVNAPVDSGIAEVVAALANFPKLCTISSTQGNDEDHGANVRFRYGIGEGFDDKKTLHESAEFFAWFSRELFKRIPLENARVTAEAFAQVHLDFKLTFDNRITEKLAQAIRDIANQ